MWTRLRLLLASAFIGSVALVYVHDLVGDSDYHWPVSFYPMYSSARRPDTPLTLFQLYGVSDDGQETPIADVPPIDHSRLSDAFASLSPNSRVAAVAAVARAEHFASVRLYRETWRAGGESLLTRTLLAESRAR